MKLTIWIDIINPSDVFFFKSLINELKSDYKFYISIRDRSETVDLANKLRIKYDSIHRDSGGVLKKINMIFRMIKLVYRIPRFDVALSFGNFNSILVSKVKKKPSIVYVDNDLALLIKGLFYERIYKKIEAHSDYIVCPSSFHIKGLVNMGAKEDHIFPFNGYKEDVYIADYIPDPNFLNELPFGDFITIRPEALFAAYVKETESIVPLLLKSFYEKGFNIVYLPRVKEDMKYAKGIDVFIPKKALNGLDLCWYSDAVLTGSGTLAREAACMGTIAVSFFPERLLSVDEQLVNEEKMFHSRDVDEIVEYVCSQSNKDKKLDLERSKKVKKQVVYITKEILNRYMD